MMQSFVQYTPTKVVFGKDTQKEAGKLVRELGVTKVFLVYGGGSVIRSGLLDEIKKSLDEEHISYEEFGGVKPNPRLSFAREGVEKAIVFGAELILAVGGGSAIDTAKGIAIGAANPGTDIWEFWKNKKELKTALPVGTVLTISAAGSEMSNSSVITKEEGLIKRGCNSDVCRAKFAILNPELTMTLPPYQTSSGCADIMMHTMERYFNQSENMDITDSIAVGLMKIVKKHAVILMTEPDNYESRAEVMWASSLSHNGITGCGTDGGDWATHKMEHELGGMFDCAHGAGLAAIWASWARYVYKERVDRFAKFAVNVMGVEPQENDDATALKGIEAMEEFYHSINMPTSIKELGIDVTEEQIQEMAEKCIVACGGFAGKVKKLYTEDVANIYRMAK